jgi:hypothetical protein
MVRRTSSNGLMLERGSSCMGGLAENATVTLTYVRDAAFVATAGDSGAVARETGKSSLEE